MVKNTAKRKGKRIFKSIAGILLALVIIAMSSVSVFAAGAAAYLGAVLA